jgi:hypothetical protein
MVASVRPSKGMAFNSQMDVWFWFWFPVGWFWFWYPVGFWFWFPVGWFWFLFPMGLILISGGLILILISGGFDFDFDFWWVWFWFWFPVGWFWFSGGLILILIRWVDYGVVNYGWGEGLQDRGTVLKKPFPVGSLEAISGGFVEKRGFNKNKKKKY